MTSSGMTIESLGVHLPGRTMSTADVVAGCVRPLSFPLERLTGIRNRHIAEEGEGSFALALKASQECLSRSRWRVEELDALFCCNISHLEDALTCPIEPSMASRLARSLGMRPDARVFDLNNACAGMFTGLYLARLFLAQNLVRNVLVVSGEYITPLMRAAQQEIDGFMDPRMACLTVGDAGAAVVLERTERADVGFHELDMQTLARHSDYCIAKLSDRPKTGPIMLTDAVRLTATAVKASVAHAIAVQKRGDWPVDWFDHLIPHQTSKMSITDAVREANRVFGADVCSEGNVICIVEERGNTATTSHFVALADAMRAGRIRTGDRVLFRVSGSGLTLGTAYYTMDDLPTRLYTDTPPSTAPQERIPSPSPARLAPRRRMRVAAEATHQRHGSHVDTVVLAVAAAEQAINAWGGASEDLGLCLHAGVYRSDGLSEPAVAALVAGKLHLNEDVPAAHAKRTFAFDVLNGSLGMLNACEIATHSLDAGLCSAALLSAAEVDRIRDDSPPPGRGIWEGGSALVLEPSPDESGFVAFAFRTFPEFHDALTSEVIASEVKPYVRTRVSPDWPSCLPMCVASIAKELLRCTASTLGDIGRVVSLSLDAAMLDLLADQLRLPRTRFVTLEEERGEWFTAALPRAFAQLRTQTLAPGTRVLLLGAGSGVTVGGAIYQL